MIPCKAIDCERMRGNFSNHAEDYDSYASVQKQVVALLGRRISQLPRTRGAVLDVGTGTGALAAELLGASVNAALVVMDIAHGMTVQAMRRLPVASACDGDARHLPFAADSFDRVVSSSVYQWVDCLPAAFSEVARVLRPQGLFALALFGDRTLFELRRSHRQAVAACDCERPSHVQSFPTLDEVSVAMERAGLHCRELLSSLEVEYHADVPTLLRQLKRIGASNAAAERPRGLASRRVMQAMMRNYEEQYRQAAGVPASYEVIVAIAEKRPGG